MRPDTEQPVSPRIRRGSRSIDFVAAEHQNASLLSRNLFAVAGQLEIKCGQAEVVSHRVGWIPAVTDVAHIVYPYFRFRSRAGHIQIDISPISVFVVVIGMVKERAFTALRDKRFDESKIGVASKQR